jgi:hypothetical protein
MARTQDGTAREVLDELAETMFAADERGRLVGPAPRLHIVRTPERLICRCHADLSEEIAEAFVAVAMRPRGRPSQLPRDYADFAKDLSAFAPLKFLRAGSLFGFPEISDVGKDESLQ